MGEDYQIQNIQSIAPDDGRKHRLTHVELTSNNILLTIYIVQFQLIQDSSKQ